MGMHDLLLAVTFGFIVVFMCVGRGERECISILAVDLSSDWIGLGYVVVFVAKGWFAV